MGATQHTHTGTRSGFTNWRRPPLWRPPPVAESSRAHTPLLQPPAHHYPTHPPRLLCSFHSQRECRKRGLQLLRKRARVGSRAGKRGAKHRKKQNERDCTVLPDTHTAAATTTITTTTIQGGCASWLTNKASYEAAPEIERRREGQAIAHRQTHTHTQKGCKAKKKGEPNKANTGRRTKQSGARTEGRTTEPRPDCHCSTRPLSLLLDVIDALPGSVEPKTREKRKKETETTTRTVRADTQTHKHTRAHMHTPDTRAWTRRRDTQVDTRARQQARRNTTAHTHTYTDKYTHTHTHVAKHRVNA